jgi:hypothetical protein
MAYLMLYGSGWTQRWRIAEGMERQIGEAITQVGKNETTQLSVLDPTSDTPATLVVAWAQVAAAVILGSGHGPAHDEATGQYA